MGPRGRSSSDARVVYPLLHIQVEPCVPPCVLGGWWISPLDSTFQSINVNDKAILIFQFQIMIFLPDPEVFFQCSNLCWHIYSTLYLFSNIVLSSFYNTAPWTLPTNSQYQWESNLNIWIPNCDLPPWSWGCFSFNVITCADPSILLYLCFLTLFLSISHGSSGCVEVLFRTIIFVS